MRDWLVHTYFAINNEILWNATEIEIPELLQILQGFQDQDQG